MQENNSTMNALLVVLVVIIVGFIVWFVMARHTAVPASTTTNTVPSSIDVNVTPPGNSSSTH